MDALVLLVEWLFGLLVQALVGAVIGFGAWAAWFHITGRAD
ncbi:hypothetical protein [Thiococcus pfennigii]|nr:hypothetical protein [Thiococcus pfennigii]